MADKPDIDLSGADDFYIGYLPSPPAAHTRLLRRALALLALLLLATLAALAAAQRGNTGGTFEYGTLREFSGILYTEPVPMLQLTSTAGDQPPAGTTLLVGAWKFGIPANAVAANGRPSRSAAR
jgi:hypothetical protein